MPLVLAVLGCLGLAPPARAAPTCTGSYRLMQWPQTSPLWEFCWTRPATSSGANGSGIEIRDVYYNGHLVLARAHVPILNVAYEPGGCGCYRDWADSETSFDADNVVSPGYAEPTIPPRTVCDTGGGGGDVGSFTGVAAEKLADRLVLTSQFQSGWYRYTMKWTFYADGRLEPRFGFAAVSAGCVAYTHTHHVYWRFDFDIDGAGGDGVKETRAQLGSRARPLSREQLRRLAPGIGWTVEDVATHRGHRLVPGAEAAAVADAFAVGDLWVLRYKDEEIDDVGVEGPDCSIRINAFINRRPPEQIYGGDLVVWYRGGARHNGGDLDDCAFVGPTLEPFGDWSR